MAAAASRARAAAVPELLSLLLLGLAGLAGRAAAAGGFLEAAAATPANSTNGTLTQAQFASIYEVPYLVPYYNYNGPLSITGSVTVETAGALTRLNWHLYGADPQCSPSGGPPDGPYSNGCGVHVHVGTSCAADAGDHYYDKVVGEDPWKLLHYRAPDSDEGSAHRVTAAALTTGLAGKKVLGHTVVVHDRHGARVACGIIGAPSWAVAPSLSAWNFIPYVGYDGPLKVGGVVSASFWPAETDVLGRGQDYTVLTWDLTGVDLKCDGKLGDRVANNNCGIHIHEGRSCNEPAGGHYYKKAAEDNWKRVHYSIFDVYRGQQGPRAASQAGGVQVMISLTRADAEGRTVVVHDSTGARVACAILM